MEQQYVGMFAKRIENATVKEYMSTPSSDHDAQQTPPNSSTVILLLRDIGDTTWRMFIPTIGFTLLGVWTDSLLDSKPIGLIIGVIVGGLAAFWLIRMQLKTIDKDI